MSTEPTKYLLVSLALTCCIFAVQLAMESYVDSTEVVLGEDDGEYAYDPSEFFPDETPDVEGQEVPSSKWHACRFQSKKSGQIYDLRPLSRNKKLLERVTSWFNANDLEVADWVHDDATIKNQKYYLNVCSDVLLVPPACKALQKKDPSPAFDVTPEGECFYLGTLRTFQWRPIDTNVPMKGMELYYENGESCGLGHRRKVKFVFTCAKHFTLKDGPMVVFQHPNGCEYEVQWPSPVGCPADPSVLSQVGLQTKEGQTTSSGKTLFGILVVLVGLAIGAYIYKKQQKAAANDYTNL